MTIQQEGAIWIAVAIVIHALVLALIAYFRATHIHLGGPYCVSGMKFSKQPGHWKYRLLKKHQHEWLKQPKPGPSFTDRNDRIQFADLSLTGVTLMEGFAWDGSSGPAKDTWTGMRASALHDIWCQAMAEGVYAKYSFRNWRLGAREYRLACCTDRMPRWRAWGRWVAVWSFGLPKLFV